MASRLDALCIDASDPPGLARFWSELLGRPIAVTPAGVALLPVDDNGFRIRFQPTTDPKTEPNQIHFDLTSTSLADQQQTVERAIGLGAHPIDVGQRPEEGHVVLADPEGNEFCVVEPDNAFLAGCGVIGALSCDGSMATGHFWSAALGWPLVWDQDEETAIQSPRGGTKISWGGPPLRPKTGKYRLHLDLVADGDLATEVQRLITLGAVEADIAQGNADGTVLTDPDGHEFCVRPDPTRRPVSEA